MNTIYPWLQSTWQRIQRLKKTNGFPQALLLSGLKGIGKASLAHVCAQWLVCLSPQERACEQCRSCHLFQEGHPDLLMVGAQSDSIGIEEIRSLQAFCQLSAHFAGLKVIVMDADKLNVYAVNALLKMLEEPATSVVFILTTAAYHLLLPTLVSRCLRISIPMPPDTESVQWMMQKGITSEYACAALMMANGAPLEAYEKLQDQQTFGSVQEGIASFFNPDLSYESVQQSLTQALPEALYFIDQHVRQLILQRLDQEVRYTPEIEQLFIFHDTIKEAVEKLRISGINKALLIESLYYQWRQITTRGNP